MDHLGSLRTKIKEDGTILSKIDYEPFGKMLTETNERTGFINKGRDKESSLLDIGVRKYDEVTGRFTSTDLLFDKYLRLNPYQYSFNNPVCYFDKNGLKPDEMFSNRIDLANDFAVYTNGKSIREDMEYQSFIYTKDGKFYYDEPVPIRKNGGELAPKTTDPKSLSIK